jgi:hypothetical protein
MDCMLARVDGPGVQPAPAYPGLLSMVTPASWLRSPLRSDSGVVTSHECSPVRKCSRSNNSCLVKHAAMKETVKMQQI